MNGCTGRTAGGQRTNSVSWVVELCLACTSYTRCYKHGIVWHLFSDARLAQSAERKALNLVVVGLSPTVGVSGKCRTSVGAATPYPTRISSVKSQH